MSYPFIFGNNYETATPYTDMQILEKGTREYNKDTPNYYIENPNSMRIDIKNICFRGEFKNHSQEELRIADYLIKKKNNMFNPTFSNNIGTGFFKPQFNATQINIGNTSPFSYNAPTPVNNPFTQNTTQNLSPFTQNVTNPFSNTTNTQYNPFQSNTNNTTLNTTTNTNTIFNPFQTNNNTNNITNLFSNNNNTNNQTNNIFSPFNTTTNQPNPFVIQATNISNTNTQNTNPFGLPANNNNTNIFNNNNNNTNIFSNNNTNQTNFFQPQQQNIFQSPFTSNNIVNNNNNTIVNNPFINYTNTQQQQNTNQINQQSNFFTCYCCPIIPHSSIGESHIMKLNELNNRLYLEKNKLLVEQFNQNDLIYQNDINESRIIFPK